MFLFFVSRLNPTLVASIKEVLSILLGSLNFKGRLQLPLLGEGTWCLKWYQSQLSTITEWVQAKKAFQTCLSQIE